MNTKRATLLSITLLAAILMSALISGCGRPKVAITMAGSTAFQSFAEKLAEQYMTIHPEVTITVQGGGSAVGVQSALSGAAQIGMADLVHLPPEAQALTATQVARDGIVIVVNPANKVAELTMAQVRDIFNGKVRNWKQLGGADADITVVSREAGSGTRTSFEQIAGGITLSHNALIQDSNGTIRETIANDVNSIGYISHGLLNEKVKALKIDGYACEAAAIAGGKYKLIRPIYLLVKGKPSPEVSAFIEYLLSQEGQSTITNDGLLPAR